MRMRLIAVGTRMPDWVSQGVQEYSKRLPRDCALDVIEIPLAKRGKNSDIERAIEQEGQQMLAALGRDDIVIALEVGGRDWSTEDLSRQLANWRMSGQDVSLLVGGPDGLSESCRRRAQAQWSLSRLTLPHPLVRILLAEQLYRAWTILNNHPYHR